MSGNKHTIAALRHRVALLEEAAESRAEDLRVLAAMERIGRRMHGAANLESLLERVLDDLLDLFDCDRAWLLYPCDPIAPSWTVPMERTRPEWPGVFTLVVKVPMD